MMHSRSGATLTWIDFRGGGDTEIKPVIQLLFFIVFGSPLKLCWLGKVALCVLN